MSCRRGLGASGRRALRRPALNRYAGGMADIEAAEREFETQLKAFEGHARSCATLAYTEFALHFYAGGDFAIRDQLNRHPAFWNAVLAGLQSSAFVALGRIFDKRSDTYSGTALIDFAEKYLGIFSRRAFEARQVRIGLGLDVAKASAARAFELRTGGLADLRQQFEAKQRIFEGKVAPIRHEVYAHAGKLTIEGREAMFTGLPLRDLEDLVVFPLRLERALFQLYHNGREPTLDPAPSIITEVIKSAPERGTSTWEHLHAAANVAGFLDWLRGTPLDDE